MLFIPPPGPPRATPSQPEFHINLTFNNFKVPNAYTSYICKVGLLLLLTLLLLLSLLLVLT